MDTPPNNRLEDIFAHAKSQAPADRAAWLDAACANQPELRAEVEALLRAHDAGGFMEGLPCARDLAIEAELARLRPEEPGERVGNYKLREKLGEGGFGIVWVADQEVPVRRRVALKIIKLGMDTKEVIARFEQERQALAMMDHSNIAKVFDAGATPFGRPFFVMELVRGIKITDYCDQAKLCTEERLKLFIAVCHAVQHAHQKGIIHRDLKPSNILVTLHDGVPVPKVIDFGVAKATQQRLTDLTIYTQFEQMIGTPLYMSPEQAEMSGLDVDTRSDIYSLGVLLYELLVGRTPFDPEQLMKRGLDEIRRTIREQEPPKPSTALQTMAAELRREVAQRRQSESDAMAKTLRGDLDWIVMKALEKDRSRRYETASAFGADVERFLSDKPVSAGPPSARYRFRKFARRNKTALGMAAAIAIILVAATVVSIRQAIRATDAEGFANARATEADIARADAARKKEEYRAMLVEAARSDRVVAEENLLAGKEREAFARLARACRYDPGSALAAEQAIAGLNIWRHPPPRVVLMDASKPQFSPDGTRILTLGPPSHDMATLGSAPPTRINNTARVWEAGTGKLLATLSGHERGLRRAQFSADGTRVLTVSDDGTARLWEAATGKRLVTFTAFKAEFSADGARIVTLSRDGARMWETATGSLLITLPGHELVSSAQFSPDGTRIVTTSNSGASIWEVATGMCLATLPCQEDGLLAQFSPNSKLLVTTSFREKLARDGKVLTYSPTQDRVIRVWDTATGKCLATLGGRVTRAELSPDSTLILTSGLDDADVRVWEASTGKSLTTLTGHKGGVTGAQFSPDGLRIVTTSFDSTARVWETATGKCLATLTGDENSVWDGQFSRDGTRILAHSSGDVRVFDAATSKRLAKLVGHQDSIESARFSPDGTRIITGSKDNTARVWELPTGDNPGILARPDGATVRGLRSVQFSPDSGRIVAASKEKIARVWEAAAGKILATFTGHEGEVWSAEFSPDGTRIVTASGDRTARIWEAATGVSLLVFRGHEDEVWSAKFSPDGARIVTASKDKTARVWDAATGKNLAVLTGHEGEVWSAEFSPDGTLIVTASRDKTARVWEAATGKILAVLTGHSSPPRSVRFSPDGTRILTAPSASDDQTARVWEAATGESLLVLGNAITAISVSQLSLGLVGVGPGAQFSPDSALVVTAFWGKTARVWDLATGRMLTTLAGHQDSVSTAQFSPDGVRVITASNDKTARVWDVASGRNVVTLIGHEESLDNAQFSPNGVRIVTVSRDGSVRVWNVLPPNSGEPPEWFVDFLQYMAQMRLNSEGQLETLKPDAWLPLREQLRAVLRAGEGKDSAYLRVLRRFVPE